MDALRSLIATMAAVITTSATAVSGAQQPVILRLNSVACASVDYCLAVGQDVTDRHGFAELWDGNAWRMVPAPDPGTPEALWDVACVAVRRCLTVGTYFDSAGVGVTLAAEWDGTAWRLLRPVSPGLDDELGAISCARGDDCVAVGATLVTGYEPLAEQWDGVRWKELPPPAPGAGALNAVACPQPASCVAVGALDAADGTPRTLAELWNGKRWRVLPTPAVARSNLVDVSCAGPSRCIATGYSYPASPPGGASQAAAGQGGTVPGLRVLTEEWDGGTWRLLPFDGPATSGLRLGWGIDLHGGATGGTGGTTGGTGGTTGGTGGGAAVTAAGAASGAVGQLPGVACGLAAGGCLAVGDYIDADGRGRTLAGAWDSGSAGGWQLLEPAYPAGAEAVLTDVSCPSPAQCMAVGDYDFTTGALPFADLRIGSQWRVLTMPDGG